MIINRLRIRGKMNLLLLPPLAAVLLVAVPFVVGQVRNAQSAGATADAARNARQLGALVWELQRERLLTAAYIASPNDQDVTLLRQHQTVADATSAARTALGPDASDELVAALTRVHSLDELRESALRRGVSLDSVARAYHAVIEAVIDALRLVPQRTSDAEGTRQLTALDALLRANEESELRGMSLIAAAVTPQTGTELVEDASSRAGQLTERFVEQADVDQAAQVVLVDQGDAARRVDEVARRLRTVRGTGGIARFAADALAAVASQSSLRRLVQDRVTGEIADAAAGRAGAARTATWTVGLGAAGLFVLVLTLAIAVSRSIVRPLQRVTQAATSVADLANTELVRVSDVEDPKEQQRPRLSAIEVTSSDEVGELAAAFNRVQATAAQLVERQIVSRRNVSLMFTNVAQRTRNLVGRQLAVVDELERTEQNVDVLAKLYRLDHLATRLQRNAGNLLVLAGSAEEARIKRPTALVTLLRAALTEIEDYRRVSLDAICEITLAPEPAADLVLLFAELLENATVFSPPQTSVEVSAEIDIAGPCQVRIVDHGIGLKPERMIQENQRLVARERLDIAPTRVLGLFVVGRLARRHGLAVELFTTPGGGTTATVTLPAALFHPGAVEPATLPPGRGTVAATIGVREQPAIAPAAFVVPTAPDDGFSWFALKPRHSAVDTGDEDRPPDGPAALPREPHQPWPDEPHQPWPDEPRRRLPGAQLPVTASTTPPVAPARSRDAAAERARMDDYQSGLARVSTEPLGLRAEQVAPATGPAERVAPATGRAAVTVGGKPPALTRRVPGTHLAPGLRDRPVDIPAQPDGGAPAKRNPDAERDAFDSYTRGWALGGGRHGSGQTSRDSDDEWMKENSR